MMNTGSKQHMSFSVWYNSLKSHDWLSCFGFLIAHIEATLGTVMGNSFVLSGVSMEIF